MNRLIKLSILAMLLVSTLTQATNLIVNPGAEDGYTGWTKTDGGSGWGISDWPTPRSGNAVWNSSYEWCTLSQTVDLVSAGYSAAYLDTAPVISSGVYVATRDLEKSGNMYYRVRVELLNASQSVITQWYTGDVAIPENTPEWQLSSQMFSDYGAGVRYVRLTFSGDDGDIYFGGQYGPAFDDAFVDMASVPEPATLALLAGGGAILFAVRRRRRK